MVNSINSRNYSNEYLNGIKDTFKRMDSTYNGGNGDGKVNTKEAYTDLNIGSLFRGMEKGSDEYNKLQGTVSNISDVLDKYAGKDGEFSAEEWAEFLNGEEWGNVLDAYHSSSARSRVEMDWVDNSTGSYKDGKCTKGEVKVGFLNNLSEKGYDIDTTSFEDLIDKYAGDDGTFTVEEYTKMKNDPMYKAFVEKFGIMPYHLDFNS